MVPEARHPAPTVSPHPAASALARSKVIGAHAREMLTFLHTHHTGEDELLFPLLRERAALDPELMDRMDAQHAQVDDAVTAIDAELPAHELTQRALEPSGARSRS